MTGIFTIDQFAAMVANEIQLRPASEMAEVIASLTRRSLVTLCAKDDCEAARWLGVSRSTLWKFLNLPKSDPRRIARTSAGKIAYAEIRRHLEADLHRQRRMLNRRVQPPRSINL